MPTPDLRPDLKPTILDILAENRFMVVATVRPDGWPQATVVGYAQDDLKLYFAVSRESQKLANIAREPRVSIALGHEGGEWIRGLSMAAFAIEVRDLHEIDRVNQLIRERHPDVSTFAPRSANAALLRATPVLISVIDLSTGPGQPTLVKVGRDLSVEPTFAAGDHDAARPA